MAKMTIVDLPDGGWMVVYSEMRVLQSDDGMETAKMYLDFELGRTRLIEAGARAVLRFVDPLDIERLRLDQLPEVPRSEP